MSRQLEGTAYSSVQYRDTKQRQKPRLDQSRAVCAQHGVGQKNGRSSDTHRVRTLTKSRLLASLGLSCRFEFRSLYHEGLSTNATDWPQSNLVLTMREDLRL